MPATMPTTSAEDAILEAAVRGRHALEGGFLAAGESPRITDSSDVLARLVTAGAEDVADALRAGDAAQALVDALAFLLALGEDHVGAEAIRRARP